MQGLWTPGPRRPAAVREEAYGRLIYSGGRKPGELSHWLI